MNGMTHINDLVEKGKKAIQEAIRNNDADLLKRCIEKLKKIGAPVPDIYAAIACCPIGLIEHTGFTLRIYSGVVDREICLGDKPDWGTVKNLLISEETDRETLKALFSGVTVETIAAASGELTASLFD